jgi:hypothetical protein
MMNPAVTNPENGIRKTGDGIKKRHKEASKAFTLKLPLL